MNVTAQNLSQPLWQFRPACEEDAEAVVRMAKALAEYEGTAASAFDRQDFIKHCVGPNRAINVLIAETPGGGKGNRESEVIGFLMYYPGYDLSTAARGNHLGDMFVDERWRKRGVGRALFAELAKITLTEGGKWVSWTVLKMNESAHEFYRSLKAVQVGVDFMAIGEIGLRQLVRHRA